VHKEHEIVEGDHDEGIEACHWVMREIVSYVVVVFVHVKKIQAYLQVM
jgi:hypothetical protein